MPVVAIVNPKGGVGKSTLATNLAGWWASQGHRVALGDLDRQQSAHHWLALRPAELAPIQPWLATLGTDGGLKLPKGCSHGVLDTPAGLHGKKLDAVLKAADRLLVPLQASLFDIQATHDFLQELADSRRGARAQVALVAMRVKEHTLALDRLHDYAATLAVPLLGSVRDTQTYVHLAAHGLTLWDVGGAKLDTDLTQWLPLQHWLTGDR